MNACIIHTNQINTLALGLHKLIKAKNVDHTEKPTNIKNV